jgi:hypothetical protein
MMTGKRLSWRKYRAGRPQSRIATIYALRDPDTGAIRYIGKTENDPAIRLRDHIASSRDSSRWWGRSKKASWIRELLAKGQKPGMIILGRVPFGDWPMWERRCIRWALEAGCDLVNGDAGGGGA